MKIIQILSIFAVAFNALILVSSLPPSGFILVPYYNSSNYTINNKTNNSCQMSNQPEWGSHSVYLGCANLTHRLLYSQRFQKDPTWYKPREKYIRYPSTGNGYENITAIRIKDLMGRNNDGFANVKSGTGVGYRVAEIRLYSPRNKGFDFEIKIYGY